LLLEKKMKDLKDYYKSQGQDLEIYHADVSFSSVKTKSMKSYLNQLPTALELEDSQVDILTGMGATLLKESSGFKAFLAAMHPYHVNPPKAQHGGSGSKPLKATLSFGLRPQPNPGTPGVH
jgi:hypothetical protein